MEDGRKQAQRVRPEPVQVSRISIRVTPRASKNEIAGYRNGVWKIRLTAPPVDNAANQELTEFLAGLFGLPKSSIAIRSGAKGRVKVIAIAGLGEAEIARRLTGSCRA